MTSEKENPALEAPAVWKMLKSIDICMFVTRAADGSHGRPMSTITMEAEGKNYVLTEASSSAARDVGADAAVLL